MRRRIGLSVAIGVSNIAKSMTYEKLRLVSDMQLRQLTQIVTHNPTLITPPD